jgi:hypothetical protein
MCADSAASACRWCSVSAGLCHGHSMVGYDRAVLLACLPSGLIMQIVPPALQSVLERHSQKFCGVLNGIDHQVSACLDAVAIACAECMLCAWRFCQSTSGCFGRGCLVPCLEELDK